jgi:multiple sugar transport system permease protein
MTATAQRLFRQHARRVPRIGRSLEPWLFLLPLLLTLMLAAYPLGNALWLSLTDKRVGAEPAFIGLKNYLDLWGDAIFIKAAINSMFFTVAAVAIKLVVGMVMALVLNEYFPMRNVARGVLALPWVIPTIVTVLIWYWMLNEMNGVINISLRSAGIISKPIPWLSQRWFAMTSIIIVNAWRGFAFFGINLLAGLQSISQELYEAAKVDGANALQAFRHITLPGLRNVIFVVTTLSTVWTLNDFQIVHILTRGGPGTSTQVFATLTYEVGISSLYLGRGIAVSLYLFPVVLIAIAVLVYFMNRE